MKYAWSCAIMSYSKIIIPTSLMWPDCMLFSIFFVVAEKELANLYCSGSLGITEVYKRLHTIETMWR